MSGTPPSPNLFVPVLDLTAGLPDPVAISTWHMALADLVGAEVTHQLFGLWLFPERGGVVLIGPDALAQDNVDVPAPDPFLTQDQLYELENTLRQAQYRSAAAVPVRTAERDVGVVLLGTFEPGAYGVPAAKLLRQLAERLAPALKALATMVTPAPPAPAGDRDDLAAALTTVANDSPTAGELVRRLSGLLHPHVPHDRLEIVTLNGSRTAVPLSTQTGRRRWGATTATWADISKLLGEFMSADGTATIASLAAEAPGLSLPGGGNGPGRISSVIGARIDLGGENIGMIIAGHAAQGLYRERDEAMLAQAARAVAPRIAAFRFESEARALRGQLEVLQSPSLPVLRAAESLAGTAHLGEALHRVEAEMRELLPNTTLRVQLRLGEDEVVELAPDNIRPLGDLPTATVASLGSRAVLESERPWTMIEGEKAGLAVGLRVAGRVIGAMILEAPHFEAPRDAAAIAQQFAAILAPHLELVRRSSLNRAVPTAGRTT